MLFTPIVEEIAVFGFRSKGGPTPYSCLLHLKNQAEYLIHINIILDDRREKQVCSVGSKWRPIYSSPSPENTQEMATLMWNLFWGGDIVKGGLKPSVFEDYEGHSLEYAAHFSFSYIFISMACSWDLQLFPLCVKSKTNFRSLFVPQSSCMKLKMISFRKWV